MPRDLFLLPGDTIAVWDQLTRRITRYTADGGLAGIDSFRVSKPSAIGFTANGWLLSIPAAADSLAIVFARAGGDGSVTRVVAQAIGERVTVQLGPAMSGSGPPLFAPHIVRAASARGAIVGDGKTYELRVYGSDGRLRSILRRDVDLSLNDSVRSAYVGASVQRGSDARALEDSVRIASRGRATVAAYDGILVDAADDVWVQDYAPTALARRRWVVFDSTWALRGTVEIPDSLRVLSIDRTTVITESPTLKIIYMFGLVVGRAPRH